MLASTFYEEFVLESVGSAVPIAIGMHFLSKLLKQ